MLKSNKSIDFYKQKSNPHAKFLLLLFSLSKTTKDGKTYHLPRTRFLLRGQFTISISLTYLLTLFCVVEHFCFLLLLSINTCFYKQKPKMGKICQSGAINYS